jgi:hypothetical protein
MAGPLAPYADAYRAELRRRGYTALSTVNELRQVGRLSSWLAASEKTAEDLSAERVEEFFARQREQGRHRASWSRPGLVCMVEVLRSLGVIDAEQPGPEVSGQERLLQRCAAMSSTLGDSWPASTRAGSAR